MAESLQYVRGGLEERVVGREDENRTHEDDTDERLETERSASRDALTRERHDRDRIEGELRREQAEHGPVDAPHRYQKRELEIADSQLEAARAAEDDERDATEASTDDQLSAERERREREG